VQALGRGLVVASVIAAGACAAKCAEPVISVEPVLASAPSSIASPQVPAPDAPEIVAAPSTGPREESPAGPPPEPLTQVPCAHGACDVDAIERCGNTERVRLAALEELGECLRKASGRASKASIREAMFWLAFRDGALSAAAGQRLVRAAVLSASQAKVLERPNVGRVLAGQTAPYRRIAESSCKLADGSEGTVELVCHDQGGVCLGGCRRRYFVATIRVDAAGLRLIGVSNEARDPGDCSCGYCL
jgi:hypothetical protein